jgi:sugar lactone lactonase YvrE
MSAPEVSVWSPEPGLLSEGARWHEQRQQLLWVDILGRRIHRATLTRDGQPGRIETVELDRDVGVVAPAAAGGYVVAATLSFLFVDESGTVTELASLADAPSGVRFNDGACDERGRFWVGTMAYDKSPGAGALYRLELDGSISTMLTGLTIPNGIGWSPDGAVMYLNDSGTGCLYKFDVDQSTGEPRNRRTLVAFEQPGPAPDGLTVDDQGDIWVAVYDGWAVHHYSPDGNLLGGVVLPIAQVTSCAFGAADRGTLFVTTGREDLDGRALALQPDAGRVFRVSGLGARGPGCKLYRGPLPGSAAGWSSAWESR